VIKTAVFNREKLQKEGDVRAFTRPYDLQSFLNLFSDLYIILPFPDIEVRSKNSDDGIIGQSPAIGDAPAFRNES
jgi:hypothetical protein